MMISQAIKGFILTVMGGVSLLVLLLVSAFSAHAQTALSTDGDITADRLTYNSPRIHHYAVGDGDFKSGTGGAFLTSVGNGGAYMAVTGAHWLVAGLHLPDGAVITGFRAYVDDSAAGDLDIWLARLSHSANGLTIMANVVSTGTPGLTNYADPTIALPVVDNEMFSYHVRVYSNNWPGNFALKIKAAVVTYTIAEAD